MSHCHNLKKRRHCNFDESVRGASEKFSEGVGTVNFDISLQGCEFDESVGLALHMLH